MRSKGKQFEQLEMFPETREPRAIRLTGNMKSGDDPIKLDGGFNPNADRDAFVQKFGSAPKDPYNWNQAELPHGMPVTKELPQRQSLAKTYHWVPTWNMATEQPSVSRNKFLYFNNDGINYSHGGRSPEGQEGAHYQDVPWTVRYEGATHDGEDLHVLADGNHRITAERHRGALFHRVGSYAALPGETPPEYLPQRHPRLT